MFILEFIFYNYIMYDVLVNDYKVYLNFKKIVNVVKKDQKIFKFFVEFMLDGQIEIF